LNNVKKCIIYGMIFFDTKENNDNYYKEYNELKSSVNDLE